MSLLRPRKRSASQEWGGNPTAKLQRTPEGRRVVAAPTGMADSMDLDAEVSSLATKFGGMHLASPFERLPDEIVVQILEHLAPKPIAVSPSTSFLDRQGDRWQDFFTERANLHSVCLVDRRLNRIATPLIYRSIFLSRPMSLSRLFLGLANNPARGSLIRNLSSSISLETEDTVAALRLAWEYLYRLQATGFRSFPELNPAFAKYYKFKKWQTWLGWCSTRGARHPKLPSVIFCAVLSLATNLESLDFLSLAPEDTTQRSGLWNWFLDEDHPFADSDMSVPSDIMEGPATMHTLSDGPRWPPPFLRDVTVECFSWGDGSIFIDLDVVPHADAIQHAAVLENSGFKTDNPAQLLRPSTIERMTGAEHSALRSYLDGLKRIPDLAYAEPGVHDHIEVLKSFEYSPVPRDFDHDAMRQLSRTVKLLPLTWSSRLSTRGKKVNMSLQDFLYTPWGYSMIENTMTMSNVQSLTLRASAKTSGLSDAATRRRSRRTNLEHRLLRESTQWKSLESLHLLTRVNGPANFLSHNRDGRLRNLGHLPRLKELSLTTESMFGDTLTLSKTFGGSCFIHCSSGLSTEISAEDIMASTLQYDGGESLKQLVDELPQNLEALRLIDWYSEYVDPQTQLPDRVAAKDGVRRGVDWTVKLSELQQAIVHGLSKLAPVLKERRPTLKHMVFWLHKFNMPEADEVWAAWCRNKEGLKVLRREYRKAGIELKVVVRGEKAAT